MTVPARQGARGFTLLEALLASVILAMAVTAIVMPFTAGARNEQVQARRILAESLAREMLEEILSKTFYDPDGPGDLGPEADETSRSLFDNMDDYHGCDEQAGQIMSLDGEVIDEPTALGLSRHVSIEYTYVSGQDLSEDPSFLNITVEVRYRGDTLIRLKRLAYAKPEN